MHRDVALVDDTTILGPETTFDTTLTDSVWGPNGSEAELYNSLVSSVGARGIMQLLPTTFRFAETVLIGHRVTHNANGNVRAGVAYIAHLLHDFHGNKRLALAGWYQGERAVRKHGLYKVSRPFVANVLALAQRM